MTAKKLRCAIYTRKSSEEGLEQEFNSLHAQREACAAYVQSQKHEGWVLLETPYDDGGFSGGTMERPAMQRLLVDIRAGLIDVVVVYKVDRLTRALTDFSKIVDTLDAHGASFVSVTQAFNTSTSMGRLTLNVLLSFAQFEREVTGERIRDKLAASAKKGMWTGGLAPIGYEVLEKKLVVSPIEAETVRIIFERFCELRSVRELRSWLDVNGYRSKARTAQNGNTSGGKPFGKGALYRILKNPIYLGQIQHRGQVYPGRHPAIVNEALWARAQATLQQNRVSRREGGTAKEPSLLAGVLFDDRGNRLVPAHAVKSGRRYRYYVCQAVHTGATERIGAIRRLPASEVEAVVTGHLIHNLQMPALIVDLLQGTLQQERQDDQIFHGAQEALATWHGADPRSQRRYLCRLIKRVEVAETQVGITWHPQGLLQLLGLNEIEPSNIRGLDFTLPVRFARIGGETRTIIQGRLDDPPAQHKDPNLIQALARSHAWRQAFLADPTLTIQAMATEAGLSERYVSQMVRLGYLAPDIVEAILAGTQPRSLSLKKLLRGVPPNWSEQRQRFGFA